MAKIQRRDGEQWQPIITAQEQSGLTAKAYCEEKGVGLASFNERFVFSSGPFFDLMFRVVTGCFTVFALLYCRRAVRDTRCAGSSPQRLGFPKFQTQIDSVSELLPLLVFEIGTHRKAQKQKRVSRNRVV